MTVKRWLETKGQILCMWLAVMRVDHGQPWGWLESLWIAIWWRYYCPRPCIDDWTARACVEGGHCGCDNQRRYSIKEMPQADMNAPTEERRAFWAMVAICIVLAGMALVLSTYP